MDGHRHRKARASIKAHTSSNLKEKLIQNCLERAKEDRAHLIWRIRLSAQDSNQKGFLRSAFRHIISDELVKIERQIPDGNNGFPESSMDDLLWEYDGLQMNSDQHGDEHEELLIEMERLLYEDLRKDLIKRELDAYEEEEEYLAQAVINQMQLNNDQTPSDAAKDNRIWCPVCKQGELKEDCQLIFCTNCDLQLDLESDKMNLNVLRSRLGEAYEEHLERGCQATPTFCMEARFKISALYIQCHLCQTFEIVV